MNNQWMAGVWFLGLAISACGSTDDAGGSGNRIGSAQLCEQQFDANEMKCPLGASSKDANVDDCQRQQQNFAGIGCLAQFNSWLSCTTKPPYDCMTDTGCERAQSSYFSCQSQAVQRTGCVRLGSQDTARCSDSAKPFAFSCLSSAPSSCVQVVTEGAGIWCCSQL